MRIVAVSDLHGDLPLCPDQTSKGYVLPAGDLLVIAGDILPDDYHPKGADLVGSFRTQRQLWWHTDRLVPWLKHNLRHYRLGIIMIPGNHDFAYEQLIGETPINKLPNGVYYLSESSVTLDGLKFYGSGWNLTQGWAFALDGEREYAVKLGMVPDDVDVLVTHGPPAIPGMKGVHWCSEVLRDWIYHTPRYKAVICGHVHEAYRKKPYMLKDVPVHVVSSKDRSYRMVNDPVIINVEKEPVELTEARS